MQLYLACLFFFFTCIQAAMSGTASFLNKNKHQPTTLKQAINRRTQHRHQSEPRPGQQNIALHSGRQVNEQAFLFEAKGAANSHHTRNQASAAQKRSNKKEKKTRNQSSWKPSTHNSNTRLTMRIAVKQIEMQAMVLRPGLLLLLLSPY